METYSLAPTEMNLINLMVNSLDNGERSASVQLGYDIYNCYVTYGNTVIATGLNEDQAYWLQDEINWK